MSEFNHKGERINNNEPVNNEPVSSLERVRMAEIKAQRELEAEASQLAGKMFDGLFGTINRGLELAAKHDLMRLVKD